MSLVIIAFVFLFAAILVAVSVGMKFYETRRKKHVTGMLQTLAGPTVATTTRLLKDLEPSEPPLLERVLRRFDLSRRVEEQARQAGLDWTARQLLVKMGVAAVPGLVLGFLAPGLIGPIKVPLMALVTSTFPYLYLRRKRSRRMAEMEEQLPDALDFLARSMRAGHAFTISLEMIGEELADPLGQEFRTLFNEQNLGAPIELALNNFSQRVPLVDVQFFCSSVLLQRQTGGNLSEILTRLSYLIRERFRLKGQVKAASAHGRMTAGVLVALPLLTVLALAMVAPDYLRTLLRDSDGRLMVGGALGAQILGNYCIKKIVKIKV
jgi:tight adherence protein B